ncbi:MAG: hypothetical protein IMF08_17970, partial [Proteobacteria bacterium]|nr:hypothetical protein [Pseudomonadota bacterium]
MTFSMAGRNFAFPVVRRRAIYAGMTRKYTNDKLVIASHNKGKVGEIADPLKYFG